MRDASWSPNRVPYGADQTIYLVVDRVSAGRGAQREVEFERTDLEMIIIELMSGRFNDPVRVVAFNTLEHWTKDISTDVAAEIQSRSDIEGEPAPDHIADFLDRHASSGALAGRVVFGDQRCHGRRQRRRCPI